MSGDGTAGDRTAGDSTDEDVTAGRVALTSRPRRPVVDAVLAADLAGLPADRRSQVVDFVDHRFRTLPHHMRLGVGVLDAVFAAVLRFAGSQRITRLSHSRAPVIGEYFRLVRSLGYAYVWETWPDTLHDGTPS